MSSGAVANHLARDPRLLLPVGALYDGGGGLPLAATGWIASAVADRVSAATGVLVAPTYWYGVPPRGGPPPGVTGVRRKTLHRVVNELLAGWEDGGVREFLILTAHGYEPHLEALLMAFTDAAATRVFDLYQVDVSRFIPSDAAERAPTPWLEWALIAHLRSRRRESYPGAAPDAPTDAPGGGSGGEERASERTLGARVFSCIVEALVREIDVGPDVNARARGV